MNLAEMKNTPKFKIAIQYRRAPSTATKIMHENVQFQR